MLNYCVIDPFLIELAKIPPIHQLSNNLPLTATEELPLSESLACQGGHILIRSLIKRVANRHILCDFFRGMHRPKTSKFKNYFEDIVFAENNKENHFLVYWREFPLTNCFEQIQTDFMNINDKDYLAECIQGIYPDTSAPDDEWRDWATKMGYLLTGCAINETVIFIAHHKTVGMLHILLNDFKSSLTSITNNYIKKYLRNCLVVETQAEERCLNLSGNLNILDNSWFLLSSTERFDRRENLSIGLNLAGMSATKFFEMLNPIRQCLTHAYTIQSRRLPPKIIALWEQNNFNIKNIISTDCFPQNQKERWHDRFIVFSSHPREQGTRSPHRFIALVFSAPFEHIFYIPNNIHLRQNDFLLRQGICLLRCDSDCYNAQEAHENIASFLANSSASLHHLCEP